MILVQWKPLVFFQDVKTYELSLVRDFFGENYVLFHGSVTKINCKKTQNLTFLPNLAIVDKSQDFKDFQENTVNPNFHWKKRAIFCCNIDVLSPRRRRSIFQRFLFQIRRNIVKIWPKYDLLWPLLKIWPFSENGHNYDHWS